MQALSAEAIKHLRHELRTPINHILGYTAMLLEDDDGSMDQETAGALRQLNAGGRTLLEGIQGKLNEGQGRITLAHLQSLDAGLRPEAQRLLEISEALQGRFQSAGAQTAATDVERVSSAFRHLLTQFDEISRKAAPETPAKAGSATEESVRLARRQATIPSAEAPAAEEAGGRLLIAEDNLTNRDLLRRRLEREGHRVSEAANGIEALEMLAAGEYDLLLLDLMMPELDGFGVLAKLQSDPRLQSLPVIMISALDEMESVVRCIEMGAEDYLPKPFDPVLLHARIGASLEKKRLRDRERQKTRDLEEALQRLKETQDQLVVQEKMASLGALTAGIAHEIKNPLNFVTNFAVLSVDLLAEMKGAIEPVRTLLPPQDAGYFDELVSDLTSNLQKIQEHGKRADAIVRGMLAHSRGGSGQPEKVDFNALVAQAVNLAYHGLRAQDRNFNIALETDYDQAMPPVEVVPQDLSRAVLNIVNNGCYAAHQKKLQRGDGFQPALRVTTRHSAGRVEVSIRDNGTGIPKTALQKIFNPFYTTKPTGAGTGLGLSLTYQIVVEQHKGALKVNTEEGEFTEFLITLPQ
ncbi:MAG TPA: response regulator [Bryobacteraceae bacterium]